MTVELNMLKENTEYKPDSEVENAKPQLRMVDLNLLTVFDAV
ncbi:transcriptional regulator LeuO, partial [Klebsiella michiganensis]